MYDTLVKAWAHWGDYLENLFTRERSDNNDFLFPPSLLIKLPGSLHHYSFDFSAICFCIFFYLLDSTNTFFILNVHEVFLQFLCYSVTVTSTFLMIMLIIYEKYDH